MGRKRPERDAVENMLKENPRQKAHEVAEAVGLIDAMGYDKAVDYIRRVKKEMKQNGALIIKYASDEERLEDIETLFNLRQGEMSNGAAWQLLLLNCYYRFRSKDDEVHMAAIDDTYIKNNQLKDPFPMPEAIHICDVALAQYMQSIDDERNEIARKRGFPGAGLNYSDQRLIEKLEITERELEHLKSIKEG